MQRVETVPLSTLLTWAWVAFVIEADNAFEAICRDRGAQVFRISFAMWANGLRCIEEEGITVRDLRGATGAACNLPGLERWGWIRLGEDDHPNLGRERPRRAGYGTSRGVTDSTVVRPRQAGSVARRVWPEVLERTELAWRDRFGSGAIENLRSALEGFGRQMPWSPPEVHPSDGFWTHIAEATTAHAPQANPAADRPDADAARASGDMAKNLGPLLGRALVELTLDHEGGSQTSLPLAANGLRVVAGAPVATRELTARTGTSKEAVAMVTGFLQRKGLATAVPNRMIVATTEGIEALYDYEEQAAAADRPQLRSALESILGRRDELALGLVPPPGCWRGEGTYKRQTNRLLANPRSALPWHPMVLHRGGWPDGS